VRNFLLDIYAGHFHFITDRYIFDYVIFLRGHIFDILRHYIISHLVWLEFHCFRHTIAVFDISFSAELYCIIRVIGRAEAALAGSWIFSGVFIFSRVMYCRSHWLIFFDIEAAGHLALAADVLHLFSAFRRNKRDYRESAFAVASFLKAAEAFFILRFESLHRPDFLFDCHRLRYFLGCIEIYFSV